MIEGGGRVGRDSLLISFLFVFCFKGDPGTSDGEFIIGQRGDDGLPGLPVRKRQLCLYLTVPYFDYVFVLLKYEFMCATKRCVTHMAIGVSYKSSC